MEQYNYCGWPDHGLPKDATPIMEMLNAAKTAVNMKTPSKILVHCSAGVGRTGTFISLGHLTSLCESKSKEDKISVFHIVRMLREQRMMMVERAVNIK